MALRQALARDEWQALAPSEIVLMFGGASRSHVNRLVRPWTDLQSDQEELSGGFVAVVYSSKA